MRIWLGKEWKGFHEVFTKYGSLEFKMTKKKMKIKYIPKSVVKWRTKVELLSWNLKMFIISACYIYIYIAYRGVDVWKHPCFPWLAYLVLMGNSKFVLYFLSRSLIDNDILGHRSWNEINVFPQCLISKDTVRKKHK